MQTKISTEDRREWKAIVANDPISYGPYANASWPVFRTIEEWVSSRANAREARRQAESEEVSQIPPDLAQVPTPPTPTTSAAGKVMKKNRSKIGELPDTMLCGWSNVVAARLGADPMLDYLEAIHGGHPTPFLGILCTVSDFAKDLQRDVGAMDKLSKCRLSARKRLGAHLVDVQYNRGGTRRESTPESAKWAKGGKNYVGVTQRLRIPDTDRETVFAVSRILSAGIGFPSPCKLPIPGRPELVYLFGDATNLYLAAERIARTSYLGRGRPLNPWTVAYTLDRERVIRNKLVRLEQRDEESVLQYAERLLEKWEPAP